MPLNMERINEGGGPRLDLVIVCQACGGLLLLLLMNQIREAKLCIKGWALWCGMVDMLGFDWMGMGPLSIIFLNFLDWQ